MQRAHRPPKVSQFRSRSVRSLQPSVRRKSRREQPGDRPAKRRRSRRRRRRKRSLPFAADRVLKSQSREKRTTRQRSASKETPEAKPAEEPASKRRGRPRKSNLSSPEKPEQPEATPSVNEKEETDELLKQKGVTVNRDGKLMIPSQKLTLPDELCKAVTNDKGKKSFACQVCNKSFLRKDKINYHIYSEHHDEFLLHGKSLPQILTKAESPTKDPVAEETPPPPPKKPLPETPKKAEEKPPVKRNLRKVEEKTEQIEKAPEPPKEKEEEEEEVEPVDSDEEKERSNQRWKHLLSACKRRYAKPMKKIRRFSKDVGRLLQIREFQKRFRNKCLYDSEEASDVMEKYGRKKESPYLIKQSNEKGKLVLRRSANDEDEFFVATDTKNPLRIKIALIDKLPEGKEDSSSEDVEDKSVSAPVVEKTVKKEEQASKENIAKPSKAVEKSEEITKKAEKPLRDRSPNKPGSEQQVELVKDVIKELKKSPPRKRARITSESKVPDPQPVKDSKPKEVAPQPPKKRGRPPKAVAAAAAVAANDVKQGSPTKNEPEVKTQNHKRKMANQQQQSDPAPPAKKQAKPDVSPTRVKAAQQENDTAVDDPNASPKYTVQPLKVKLKTVQDDEAASSKEDKPLKLVLKLSGNGNSEKEHKTKKHKKKKEKNLPKLKINLGSEQPSLSLKIKQGSIVQQPQEPSERPRSSAARSDSAVTFSPESSPEHKPAFGSFLGKFDDIGLNEGTFNDVMKAIDGIKDRSSLEESSQVDGSVDRFSDDENVADNFASKTSMLKHVFGAQAKPCLSLKFQKPLEVIKDIKRIQRRRQTAPKQKAAADKPVEPKAAASNKIECYICLSQFPNRIRLLAHFQEHTDDDFNVKIDQLDGAFDLPPDSPPATTSSTTVVASSTPAASTAGSEESIAGRSSFIYSHDEELTSASPSSILTQTSSIDSSMNNNHFVNLQRSDFIGELEEPATLTSYYGCSQCNVVFSEQLDLEAHIRKSHAEGGCTPTQVVTVFQPQQPTQDLTFTSPSVVNHRSDNLMLSLLPEQPTSVEHPLLMEQDPVLMSNKEEESGLMLDDDLQLFDDHQSLMDSSATDSAVQFSLDDLTFAQPLVATDGSHASFDTSIETSSFLSGNEALDDILSETTNGTSSATVSIAEAQPSESRTPSLPDDGEYPCSHCEKKFGNRRNLLSHMRRHTGDFKLFCDSCGKGFFTQSKLDSHKRKHTGKTSLKNNFSPTAIFLRKMQHFCIFCCISSKKCWTNNYGKWRALV